MSIPDTMGQRELWLQRKMGGGARKGLGTPSRRGALESRVWEEGRGHQPIPALQEAPWGIAEPDPEASLSWFCPLVVATGVVPLLSTDSLCTSLTWLLLVLTLSRFS